MLKIDAKHPVRQYVRLIANTKWPTKRSAISAIQDALASAGMQFNPDGPIIDVTDDDGHVTIPIHREGDNAEYGHMVVFAWHRFPSGQYEITTYVS
jgi:hypothetical protein